MSDQVVGVCATHGLAGPPLVCRRCGARSGNDGSRDPIRQRLAVEFPPRDDRRAVDRHRPVHGFCGRTGAQAATARRPPRRDLGAGPADAVPDADGQHHHLDHRLVPRQTNGFSRCRLPGVPLGHRVFPSRLTRYI